MTQSFSTFFKCTVSYLQELRRVFYGNPSNIGVLSVIMVFVYNSMSNLYGPIKESLRTDLACCMHAASSFQLGFLDLLKHFAGPTKLRPNTKRAQ